MKNLLNRLSKTKQENIESFVIEVFEMKNVVDDKNLANYFEEFEYGSVGMDLSDYYQAKFYLIAEVFRIENNNPLAETYTFNPSDFHEWLEELEVHMNGSDREGSKEFSKDARNLLRRTKYLGKVDNYEGPLNQEIVDKIYSVQRYEN